MAQLYVRINDKVNEDKYLDAKCYKRGDVVEIVQDSHQWGEGELKNANHIIIQVPGVDAEKLTAFLVPEMGDPQIKQVLQRRGFCIDMNLLAQHDPKKPLTETDILSFKMKKDPKIDPNVIGK